MDVHPSSSLFLWTLIGCVEHVSTLQPPPPPRERALSRIWKSGVNKAAGSSLSLCLSLPPPPSLPLSQLLSPSPCCFLACFPALAPLQACFPAQWSGSVWSGSVNQAGISARPRGGGGPGGDAQAGAADPRKSERSVNASWGEAFKCSQKTQTIQRHVVYSFNSLDPNTFILFDDLSLLILFIVVVL